MPRVPETSGPGRESLVRHGPGLRHTAPEGLRHRRAGIPPRRRGCPEAQRLPSTSCESVVTAIVWSAPCRPRSSAGSRRMGGNDLLKVLERTDWLTVDRDDPVVGLQAGAGGGRAVGITSPTTGKATGRPRSRTARRIAPSRARNSPIGPAATTIARDSTVLLVEGLARRSTRPGPSAERPADAPGRATSRIRPGGSTRASRPCRADLSRL